MVNFMSIRSLKPSFSRIFLTISCNMLNAVVTCGSELLHRLKTVGPLS